VTLNGKGKGRSRKREIGAADVSRRTILRQPRSAPTDVGGYDFLNALCGKGGRRGALLPNRTQLLLSGSDPATLGAWARFTTGTVSTSCDSSA
jgi:hypothetical protein